MFKFKLLVPNRTLQHLTAGRLDTGYRGPLLVFVT